MTSSYHVSGSCIMSAIVCVYVAKTAATCLAQTNLASVKI